MIIMMNQFAVEEPSIDVRRMPEDVLGWQLKKTVAAEAICLPAEPLACLDSVGVDDGQLYG